jgi:two-component system phosphate regulon sensor histidine kinase PhoR
MEEWPGVDGLQGGSGRALRYAADEGVVVGDSEGRITLVNPAAERILGVQANEAVGKLYWEVVQPLGGQVGRSLAGVVGQLVRCPLPGAAKVIRVGIAADSRAVEMRLSPLVDGTGGVIGIVGVLRDVANSAEIDRARSEFVSTVSHELRGPAAAIKGYTDLLQSEVAGSLSEEQKELVAVLKRNSDRMAELINDLLDVSLIDSGRLRMEWEWVESEEIIKDVIAALRVRAEAKRQLLRWDRRGEVPPLRGDRGRLHQVLVNLVDNAIRYTEEGGSIDVHLQAVEGAVRVDVEDTGIGIPADELGRVFQRFYRGRHELVQASPGTGLGLSIVQMLVEMHGGRVWVESVPAGGSTFTFILPVASDEAPATGAVPE